MYADKFKIKKEKMMRKLWGDNFYNTEEKKWTKTPFKGSERGFNKFVLDPVIKVIVCIFNIFDKLPYFPYQSRIIVNCGEFS